MTITIELAPELQGRPQRRDAAQKSRASAPSVEVTQV